MKKSLQKWPAWGANTGTGLALFIHNRRAGLGPWVLLFLPPMLRPPISGLFLGACSGFTNWEACGKLCGDSPES